MCAFHVAWSVRMHINDQHENHQPALQSLDLFFITIFCVSLLRPFPLLPMHWNAFVGKWNNFYRTPWSLSHNALHILFIQVLNFIFVHSHGPVILVELVLKAECLGMRCGWLDRMWKRGEAPDIMLTEHIVCHRFCLLLSPFVVRTISKEQVFNFHIPESNN